MRRRNDFVTRQGKTTQHNKALQRKQQEQKAEAKRQSEARRQKSKDESEKQRRIRAEAKERQQAQHERDRIASILKKKELKLSEKHLTNEQRKAILKAQIARLTKELNDLE